MKVKNKGFTLVELLAVMVILVIIIAISVPIVFNIINNVKKEAFKASVYGVLESGEFYYVNELTLEGTFDSDMVFEFPDANGLNLKGTKPLAGNMIVYKNGKIEITAHNNRYCAKKDKDESEITIFNEISECLVEIDGTDLLIGKYKEKLLNGADPVVEDGMIPVIIEEDGTVRKANLLTEWYKYGDKKWANAVLVTAETRENYEKNFPNSVINEHHILAYFVWIPRYRYQLWNVDGNNTSSKELPLTIEVAFEDSKTTMQTGTTNDAWLTHPAFCFGRYNETTGVCNGDKVNGYWVGKFESGYRQNDDLSTTDTWTKDGGKYAFPNTSKILVKPNINSWRNMSVSNIFSIVKGMTNKDNIFGLTSTSDAHLIKNMEWGGVVYLSHSKYGINGPIRINNNSNFKTGCAADTENKTGSTNCDVEYASNAIQLASTTGNITGIYDMSGGTREYVMGYTTGATKKYGDSGFTDATFPLEKYYDEYTSTTRTDYSNGKLGDATKEMGPFVSNLSPWYKDYGAFVTDTSPWFHRGDNFINGTEAGCFQFNNQTGTGGTDRSFRIVILKG